MKEVDYSGPLHPYVSEDTCPLIHDNSEPVQHIPGPQSTQDVEEGIECGQDFRHFRLIIERTRTTTLKILVHFSYCIAQILIPVAPVEIEQFPLNVFVFEFTFNEAYSRTCKNDRLVVGKEEYGTSTTGNTFTQYDMSLRQNITKLLPGR